LKNTGQHDYYNAIDHKFCLALGYSRIILRHFKKGMVISVMTKRELKFLLTDLELYSSKKITEEEAVQKDPQTIYHENGRVYEWEDTELDHEDMLLALQAKQTADIHAIKNICGFFAFVLCIFLIWLVFSLFAIVL